MPNKGPYRLWGIFSLLTLAFLFFEMLVTSAHETTETNPSLVYECAHDLVSTQHDKMRYAPVKYRGHEAFSLIPILSASTREHIRFHAVYMLDGSCSYVGQYVPTYTGKNVICTDKDIITPRRIRAIKKLMTSAFNFLGQALLVEPLLELKVTPSACYHLGNAPLTVREKDFVVFVTANPGEIASSAVAWAITCQRDIFTLRPVVGHINFIPSLLDGPVTQLKERVAWHELTHALGFGNLGEAVRITGGFFGPALISSKVIYREKLGKLVTLVTSPKVLEVARRYFGCPELDGVEVEDAGGLGTAGSHWKKRILYDEVLVGTFTSARLFYSSFTLAFLEDLGFYSVNYDMAEDELQWGRNRKCRFLYNKCNDQDETVNEFCFNTNNKNRVMCTHDQLGVGLCSVVQYNSDLPSNYRYFDDPRQGGYLDVMDFCPFVTVFRNSNCIDQEDQNVINIYGNEFGYHSRCFVSDLITGSLPRMPNNVRCLPMTCTDSGQILIRVQGQTVPCPADGRAGVADTSRLRGIYGEIKCPEASTLCQPNEKKNILPISTGAITTGVKTHTGVQHSPLNFGEDYETSCKKRVECAEQLTFSFSACRPMAKKILDCFGRDCQLEMRMWFDRMNFTRECKDIKKVAKACFDDWTGANELCALISTV